MFYAHFVLSKKGALARIWLAAHWDKKLTKANIFETNIETSVEAIMQPQVKLALRTSGHLLLGVVRIYSRKAKYLLADCSDAIVKMKMVFRPGAVDLPEDGREAAFAAVTLQENFYEFDAFLPPVSGFDVYQSQREEITLKEDMGYTLFKLDDGFGDIGFDEESSEVVAQGAQDISLEIPVRPVSPMQVDSLSPTGDIFGFEEDEQAQQNILEHEFGGEMDHNLLDEANNDELFRDTSHMVAPEVQVPPQVEVAVEMARDVTVAPDQTTLFMNDDEAFALGPIDTTAVGTERKLKKKRKLVVDERNLIPSAVMREQLTRAGDLVVQLDLAPPTKKLMEWKEFGGVDKLLAIPGKRFPARALSKLFSRNLVTRAVGDQEYATEVVSKRWEEIIEMVDRDMGSKRRRGASIAGDDMGLERRRGASTAGETARDMSRLSIEPNVSLPLIETSLPLIETSAMSDPVNVSMPRVSLPDVNMNMSSLLAPPSPPPAVSAVPIYFDADVTVFDRTLRATTVGNTSGGAEELLDETQLMCKRSDELMSSISQSLESRRDVVFSTLVKKSTRKQVAVNFYTLLTLHKLHAIEVSQKKPYGGIRIVKGPAFASYA